MKEENAFLNNDHVFIFKWSISPYFLLYSITNVLGLIGLTLTFISGILGIKAYNIEIMKQLKTIFTKL